MNNILLYLFQATFVFSVLYLLYKVFLEKLTFHRANRIVLLVLLPFSIVIPFVSNVAIDITPKSIEIPLFDYTNIKILNYQLYNIKQPFVSFDFQYSLLFTSIYTVVLLICLIRFLNNIKALFTLKNQSEIEQKNGYKIVTGPVNEIFSCFNWVFIPKTYLKIYDSKIIAHEKMHIQLKHSWDVIITELYTAFFWFNPLLYFYKKSLKSIHEFQADKGVLDKGVKASDYMQLLLQKFEVSKPNNLYNYFNQPILKKRVEMLTKPKSNGITKLYYTLLLLVCMFLITAFNISDTIENNSYLQSLDISESRNNKIPSLFPVKDATKEDISSYYNEIRLKKNSKKISHNGIDIKAKIGTPIFATADGVINTATLNGGWGNLIIINHADRYETWYAHLDRFNITENQKVKKGALIGYVGVTGKSTRPHLHYEVKQNDKNLNPINFIGE